MGSGAGKDGVFCIGGVGRVAAALRVEHAHMRDGVEGDGSPQLRGGCGDTASGHGRRVVAIEIAVDVAVDVGRGRLVGDA